jgi:hypothetical protein
MQRILSVILFPDDNAGPRLTCGDVEVAIIMLIWAVAAAQLAWIPVLMLRDWPNGSQV